MADFIHLFDYIERKSSVRLSEDERNLIMTKLKPKKLRKRQYFLQEGDVCKYMGFIVSGATRMFAVDEKGHEHILHFGLEEWWVGDYESFHLLTPSKYYVEALEDESFHNLLPTSPQGRNAIYAHALSRRQQTFVSRL